MSVSGQDLEDFKAEAVDLLDTAEKALLKLDNGGEFVTQFDNIFRCFHNLKGSAGMMELSGLQAHTHELESILMGFKGVQSIPKSHIDLFLRGIDAARGILNGDYVTFDFTVAGAPVPASVPASGPAPVAEHGEMPKEALGEFFAECEEIVERISGGLQGIEAGSISKEGLDCLYRDAHSLKGTAYLFSYKRLGDLSHALESSLEKVRSGTHQPSQLLINGLFKALVVIEKLLVKARSGASDAEWEVPIQKIARLLAMAADKLEKVDTVPAASAVSAAPVAALATQEPHAEGAPSQKEKDQEGASSIRVSIALLDSLMNLMGEMVLVRNQVLQFSNRTEDLEFQSLGKRLNVVTSEIQGEMMKTRMQPIGNVLTKFNRVVRDLSQELNKKITLCLTGSETELDKSLLEAIKDPLTHIVRNSCDHGIEAPEQRRAEGKPEAGTIQIRAYHEGGQVIVEVQDDGKGLHREKLLQKALEKALVTQAEAARLNEKQVFNLIFAPGFSTAAQITNVSGRGVGMDVVRTNIERIGGTVDLTSVPGEGTTIKLKIPLTLAIVPALTVRCGNGTFAIPQVKLEELVRVDQGSAANRIECLHGAPVLRLRGNILPLVDLNRVLNIGRERDFREGIINIAVVCGEQNRFGLVLDEIRDNADIVVKPINRLLKSMQAYSGATILGDGSVALILDVLGISKLAKIGQEKAGENAQNQERPKQGAEQQDYLLIGLNSPTRHALVLGYVHRLEEFSRKQLEYSGSQPVIRYGNTILPLIHVNKGLGYPEAKAAGELIPTVVIRRAGVLFGLVVDSIVDTLSSSVEMDAPPVAMPGIFGNLNTESELIVVVDPFELIRNCFPDLPEAGDPQEPARANPRGAPQEGPPARILLAEDTIFFRKAIAKVLEKSGYAVTPVNDGKEAFDALEAGGGGFDLVISDIEMPKMNGFQLAKAIRNHPRLAGLPLLAVSSRADPSFMAEGKRAGYDLYLEKLKPALLLGAVEKLISKKRGAA